MMRSLYAIGVASLVAGTALADDSTTYALATAGSDVYVVIRNDTDATLARLGHDHVVYAQRFTGSVTWPNADGGACAIDIRLPVASLVIDPPGLRAKAGLDDRTVDDGDKEKIRANMWSASQLDSKSFSEIRFQGNKCSGRTGQVKVDGTLTIRGKAKAVSVTMKVDATPTKFSASGSFDATHTAFDFKPFAASMLGPRNQDRLSFTVSVVGTPKP